MTRTELAEHLRRLAEFMDFNPSNSLSAPVREAADLLETDEKRIVTLEEAIACEQAACDMATGRRDRIAAQFRKQESETLACRQALATERYAHGHTLRQRDDYYAVITSSIDALNGKADDSDITGESEIEVANAYRDAASMIAYRMAQPSGSLCVNAGAMLKPDSETGR